MLEREFSPALIWNPNLGAVLWGVPFLCRPSGRMRCERDCSIKQTSWANEVALLPRREGACRSYTGVVRTLASPRML